MGTARSQGDLGRAGFGWCGTLRKDSIDFEARELLRNKVLGSPAKQERVCGLGDDHRSPTKQLQSWGAFTGAVPSTPVHFHGSYGDFLTSSHLLLHQPQPMSCLG